MMTPRLSISIKLGIVAIVLAGGTWGLLRYKSGPRRPADHDGRSLQEVAKQIQQQTIARKRSQEWVLADEGRVDELFAAYRKIPERKSDERASCLGAIVGSIKPRDKWPAGFDQAKANSVVDFLITLLVPGHPGRDPVLAADGLATIASRIGDRDGRIEEALLRFQSEEKRPGVQGRSLNALGKLHSARALPILASSALSKDSTIARAAIYGLAEYRGTELEGGARRALLAAARSSSSQRPLAIKLLARSGDRRIASIVPKLLKKGATPQDVEAGAYAAGVLKLRETRSLLEARSKDANPMVQPQIRAALDSLK